MGEDKPEQFAAWNALAPVCRICRTRLSEPPIPNVGVDWHCVECPSCGVESVARFYAVQRADDEPTK